jgi:hypothetical protein
MLDRYGDLSGQLRERAKEKMQQLQTEIETLQRDLTDWRDPFDDLVRELEARRESLKRAKQVLANGAAAGQKTEALSAVMDHIVCHFRHEGTKSFLDKVEIVPASGDSVCFTVGSKPAPN